MQGRRVARFGLALLFGVIGPALAAGAELRAAAGARIVQAGAVTAGDTAGSITVTGAPLTAVSLSITGGGPAAAEALSEAGATPATDATGALVIHLAEEPGTYRIIVHY